VLKVAAATLQANVRPDALLARSGGEEFVAVVQVDECQWPFSSGCTAPTREDWERMTVHIV
jgi:GGDEF domain-containing protein